MILENERVLIYRLIFGNGKVYIGKTTDFSRRMNGHRTSSKTKRSKLYNGWRKHGLVSAEVIFICCIASFSDFERQFISEYDSQMNGYNSTSGGELTVEDSPVWKDAHSKGIEEKYSTGTFRSEQAKRMSERVKEFQKDPEFIKMRSNVMKSLHADPDFTENRINAVKKRHADPEYKMALSKRSKATTNDPFHKIKMEIGRQIFWANRNGRAYTSLLGTVPKHARFSQSKR